MARDGGFRKDVTPNMNRLVTRGLRESSLLQGHDEKRRVSNSATREDRHVYQDYREPEDAILIPNPMQMDTHRPKQSTYSLQKNISTTSPHSMVRKKPGANNAFQPRNSLNGNRGRGGARGAMRGSPRSTRLQHDEIIDVDARSEGPNKRAKLSGDSRSSQSRTPMIAPKVKHADPFVRDSRENGGVKADEIEDSEIDEPAPPSLRSAKKSVKPRDSHVSGLEEYNKIENMMNPKNARSGQTKSQESFLTRSANAVKDGLSSLMSFNHVAIPTASPDELSQSQTFDTEDKDRKRTRRSTGASPDEKEQKPTIDLWKALNGEEGESDSPQSVSQNGKRGTSSKSASKPFEAESVSKMAASKLRNFRSDDIDDNDEDELSFVKADPKQLITNASKRKDKDMYLMNGDNDDIPTAVTKSTTPKQPRKLRKSSPVEVDDKVESRRLLLFKKLGISWEGNNLQITLIQHGKSKADFIITRNAAPSDDADYLLKKDQVNKMDISDQSVYVLMQGGLDTKTGRASYFYLGFTTPEDTQWFQTHTKRFWPVVKVCPREAKYLESVVRNPPGEKERVRSIAVDEGEDIKIMKAQREKEQYGILQSDVSTGPKGSRIKDKLLPKNGALPQYGQPSQPKAKTVNSDFMEANIIQEPRRNTRSRRSTDHDVVSLDEPKSFEHDNGPRWSHQVVFGSTFQNRAIVDWNDLHRLNNNEFLNDSLIGYYVARLRDKFETTENQAYFFSTHFYTSLTSARNRTNYKSIERWTKTVDIFNYDYVIIPVNESYHWYLVVICNLPFLSRSGAIDEQKEENEESSLEIVSERKSTRNDSDELRPGSLGSQVLNVLGRNTVSSDDNKGTSFTLEDAENWPPSSSTTPSDQPGASDKGTKKKSSNDTDVTVDEIKSSRSTKNKKSRGPPAKKYDKHAPAIVILDSMAGSHQNTFKNLRDYLAAEALSKRGMEISKEGITAFHARRGIPQQNNFADCGLFVCGYIEKFIQNPGKFGKKLLEQSFELDDWKIHPDQMRLDIRSQLIDLHKEQDARRQEEAAEKARRKLQCKADGKLAETAKSPPNHFIRSNSPHTPQTSPPPRTSPATVHVNGRSTAKEKEKANSKEASKSPRLSPPKTVTDHDIHIVSPNQPESKSIEEINRPSDWDSRKFPNRDFQQAFTTSTSTGAVLSRPFQEASGQLRTDFQNSAENFFELSKPSPSEEEVKPLINTMRERSTSPTPPVISSPRLKEAIKDSTSPERLFGSPKERSRRTMNPFSMPRDGAVSPESKTTAEPHVESSRKPRTVSFSPDPEVRYRVEIPETPPPQEETTNKAINHNDNDDVDAEQITTMHRTRCSRSPSVQISRSRRTSPDRAAKKRASPEPEVLESRKKVQRS